MARKQQEYQSDIVLTYQRKYYVVSNKAGKHTDTPRKSG
ncbi:hypothetical protein HNQ91_003459 [Filimonas zeae]|nr:hypothetical protein [Filimonas zeae]